MAQPKLFLGEMDLGIGGCDPFPMGKRPIKHDTPRKRLRAAKATFDPLPWKSWFKLCGVKQREVAEAIGEEEGHISNMNAGRRKYMRPHLEKMSRFLSEKSGRKIEPWMLLLEPDDPRLAVLLAAEAMRSRPG